MDTVHECDRQTDGDGRTDRITITNTVQRIASHGKNPPRFRGNFSKTVFFDQILHAYCAFLSTLDYQF